MEEYSALENLKSAANYDGIGQARCEKPKKRLADDREIPEDAAGREGYDEDIDVDESLQDR